MMTAVRSNRLCVLNRSAHFYPIQCVSLVPGNFPHFFVTLQSLVKMFYTFSREKLFWDFFDQRQTIRKDGTQSYRALHLSISGVASCRRKIGGFVYLSIK